MKPINATLVSWPEKGVSLVVYDDARLQEVCQMILSGGGIPELARIQGGPVNEASRGL